MNKNKKFDSLASFVSFTREHMGISQVGLAKKANLSEKEIEAIEGGIDLFLSSTVRQKLAKALKVNPSDIKIYEKSLNLKNDFDENSLEIIKERILQGDDELFCPVCSSKLNVRIAKMFDLEDNLVFVPKANCTKCPFQLK